MVSVKNSAARRVRARNRRQAERGAAVFIVVMVLTLLTAVGIFAVRSASLADVAAGYDREASQATLVAQYGSVATAAYLGTPGGSAIASNLQINSFCQTNSFKQFPCFKTGSGLFETSVLNSSGEDLFETSSPSLNASGKTDADFSVEITEPAKTGKPTQGSQSSPVQVTVSVVAQVRPAGACVNGVGTTWNAGQQMVRSYITAGNLVNQ